MLNKINTGIAQVVLPSQESETHRTQQRIDRSFGLKQPAKAQPSCHEGDDGGKKIRTSQSLSLGAVQQNCQPKEELDWE